MRDWEDRPGRGYITIPGDVVINRQVRDLRALDDDDERFTNHKLFQANIREMKAADTIEVLFERLADLQDSEATIKKLKANIRDLIRINGSLAGALNKIEWINVDE